MGIYTRRLRCYMGNNGRFEPKVDDETVRTGMRRGARIMYGQVRDRETREWAHHRVMISENPSSQLAQDPDMPPIV